MRQKFIVTESERDEIRKLYNIQEQRFQFGSYKETTGGGTHQISTNFFAFQDHVKRLKTPEEMAKQWKVGNFDPTTGQVDFSGAWGSDYQKTEQKILSMMDPKSQEVWKTIPQKNPMFYMYALLHYSNYTFGKRSKVVVDNNVTITQEPIVTPGEPTGGIDVEGIEMTTKGAQQPTLFVINEPILTDEFKQFLTQNIINVVKDNIAEASKVSKVTGVHIGKLFVTSSCSTAPNKQSKTFGKIPTFLELSKARGEVVYNFITDSLKTLGVPVTYEQNEKVMGVNFKGSNGDGTSGPAWSEVTASGGDYKNIQQYQRADVDFLYGVVTQKDEQQGPTEPEDVITYVPKTTEDFIIRVTEKGRTRRRFFFTYTPKTRIPNAKKRLKCPIGQGRGR